MGIMFILYDSYFMMATMMAYVTAEEMVVGNVAFVWRLWVLSPHWAQKILSPFTIYMYFPVLKQN